MTNFPPPPPPEDEGRHTDPPPPSWQPQVTPDWNQGGQPQNQQWTPNQQSSFGGGSGQPPKKTSKGMLIFLWALLICGVLAVVCCVGGFGALIWFGDRTPETFAQPGDQVDQRHMQRMRELQLIPDGEKVIYFYSDAMLDVDEGVYFLTDKHLVLYSSRWSPPKLTVPYTDIIDVSLARDESFFVDSQITIETSEGDVWMFPVSSEMGGDQRFYNLIMKNAGLAEE